MMRIGGGRGLDGVGWFSKWSSVYPLVESFHFIVREKQQWRDCWPIKVHIDTEIFSMKSCDICAQKKIDPKSRKKCFLRPLDIDRVVPLVRQIPLYHTYPSHHLHLLQLASFRNQWVWSLHNRAVHLQDRGYFLVWGRGAPYVCCACVGVRTGSASCTWNQEGLYMISICICFNLFMYWNFRIFEIWILVDQGCSQRCESNSGLPKWGSKLLWSILRLLNFRPF